MAKHNLNGRRLIEPEVLPASSRAGIKANRLFPKWAIYGGIAATSVLVFSSLRGFIPLIAIKINKI